MIGRRTIFVVLLVLFVVDMIQAGVIEDIGEAIHYDKIKEFTQGAAKKTEEAATSAFNTVKNFFVPISSSTTPATETVTEATS